MNKNIKRIQQFTTTVVACITAMVIGVPYAFAGPYEDQRTYIGITSGVHIASYYPALVPGLGGAFLGSVEFGANLGLKYIPAYMEAPLEVVMRPAPATCHASFNHMRRLQEERLNFLDIGESWSSPFFSDGVDVDPSWGVLGEPTIDHYHTDTRVSVMFGDRTLGINPDFPELSDTQVFVPVGINVFTWRADTLITPALDQVPWHFISPLTKHGANKAKAVAKNRTARDLAFEFVKEVLQTAAEEGIFHVTDNLVFDSVVQNGIFTEVKQRFVVIDENPPVIHASPALTTGLTEDNPYIVRAVDPGGSKFESFSAELMSNFTASDDCAFGEPVKIEPVLTPHTNGSRAPTGFFETNEIRKIIIRATDAGPIEVQCVGNEPPTRGEPGLCYTTRGNEQELSVWVKVEDHEPPLLIPPHNRVIEATAEMLAQGFATRATSDTVEGDPLTVDVGNPSVFDLGDRYPTVTDNGINQFPVDARTTIMWTATDIANNIAGPLPQVITIKDPDINPNTAPSADAKIASTKVSSPVAITLTGSDSDIVGGEFDPLNFEIVQQPANGFLVTPPYPYFIEDYRQTWQEENAPCRDDSIRFPRQISVADDGTTFVLGAKCGGGQQITIFDDDGVYLSKTDVTDEVNNFEVLDGVAGAFDLSSGEPASAREPGIYFVREGQVDSTAQIRHREIRGDGTVEPDDFAWNSWNLPDNAIRLMAIDTRGYIWTLGSNRLGIYRVSGQQSELDRITMVNEQTGETEESNLVSVDLLNGKAAAHLATDSQDYLYVSQPNRGRIYKFAPANSGDEPIEFVGWMGFCEGGPDCDTANQRSYGFSCTDDTCTVPSFKPDADLEACGWELTSNFAFKGYGCEPGQFNFPTKVALDPDDNIYVADYGNLRVQRFTPRGEFTGEAKSTCDGSCFVLGDFGRPFKMTVNSFGFYVLDEAKKLLHVFKASPFTEVTANSAVVKYQPSFDILNANEFSKMDEFFYAVNDGLATSTPASVSITVGRNHRAPRAKSEVLVGGSELDVLPVLEDVPTPFVLQGTDPDPQDISGLTFAIATPPANGTLSGIGADQIYTPNENFVGTDEFSFTVSDINTSDPSFVSEMTIVHIDVTPVPDAPTIAMPDPLEAGIGFPVRIMVDVIDPDSDAADMQVFVNWGDGCVDQINASETLISCSIASADEQPDDSGSLSLTLAADNPGLLVAEHIYRTSGIKLVTVCIGDDDIPQPPILPGTDACTYSNIDVVGNTSVTVLPKADVITIIEDDLPRDENNQVIEAREAGKRVIITMTIRNRFPSADSNGGDTALSSTTAIIELDELLEYWTVPTGCSLTPGGTPRQRACSIPGLAPGEETVISFAVSGRPDIFSETEQAITVSLDATEPDVDGGYFWATLLPFKMNPALDADNDGVPNGEDAFPGDPNESVDTDSDGIGNNADLDDDGDGMPDAWENRFGLDSLDMSDANIDADGDGISAMLEYMKGTRPDLADSDRDGKTDDVDNCGADFNRNQYDENDDFIGDVCDPRSFVAAVSIGDPDGDTVPDMALLRTSGGASTVYVKGGADDSEIAVFDVLAAPAQPEKLLSLSGLGGSTAHSLALIYSDDTGVIHVKVSNAWTGDTIADFPVFTNEWTFIDAAVSADATNSETLLLLVKHDDGRLSVSQWNPQNGSQLSEIEFFSREYEGYALAAVGDGAALVVAINPSGELVAQAIKMSTGVVIRDWVLAVGNWLRVDVLGGDDGFVTVTTDTGGQSQVGTWSLEISQPITQFGVFDNAWTPLGLGEVAWDTGINAITVVASDTTGDINARVYNPVDGIELNRISYLSATDTPRGMHTTDPIVAASESRISVLASNADADVSLEQRAAPTGEMLVTLTATSELAPILPPPPPPPPPPRIERKSGGGAIDIAMLIFAVAGLRLRRRQLRAARTRTDLLR